MHPVLKQEESCRSYLEPELLLQRWCHLLPKLHQSFLLACCMPAQKLFQPLRHPMFQEFQMLA